MLDLLRIRRTNKAPGSDSIPNDFLKVMGEPIGKLIEALTANRLRDAAEEHGLLLDTQMGARRGQSTETALELLIEQVRTIWTSKKHVASLLSLDISGAFDTVNPTRLLDTLRKKRIPGWLVRWVQAFMTDRTTTLVVQGQESELLPVEAGVPQGVRSQITCGCLV